MHNDVAYVTFEGFWISPDEVHETSEFLVVGSGSSPTRVRVIRDLTSDVRAFEGGEAVMFEIAGLPLSIYQVVRLAMPLSPSESSVVDASRVLRIKQFLGPLAWSEMLTLLPPIGHINKRKYSAGRDPSLSLDASDWLNTSPTTTVKDHPWNNDGFKQ